MDFSPFSGARAHSLPRVPGGSESGHSPDTRPGLGVRSSALCLPRPPCGGEEPVRQAAPGADGKPPPAVRVPDAGASGLWVSPRTPGAADRLCPHRTPPDARAGAPSLLRGEWMVWCRQLLSRRAPPGGSLSLSPEGAGRREWKPVYPPTVPGWDSKALLCSTPEIVPMVKVALPSPTLGGCSR